MLQLLFFIAQVQSENINLQLDGQIDFGRSLLNVKENTDKPNTQTGARKQNEEAKSNYYDVTYEPYKLKDDPELVKHTKEILTRTKQMFTDLKNTVDEDLKLEINTLSKAYKKKYKEFIKQNENAIIKSRFGRKNFVLNAVDTSNFILRRLLNYLSDHVEKKALRTNTLNFVDNKMNRTMTANERHICKTFGFCRQGPTFLKFLRQFSQDLLSCPRTKSRYLCKGIFNEIASQDFRPVLSRNYPFFRQNSMPFRDSSDEDKKCVDFFVILRNAVVNVHKPYLGSVPLQNRRFADNEQQNNHPISNGNYSFQSTLNKHKLGPNISLPMELKDYTAAFINNDSTTPENAIISSNTYPNNETKQRAFLDDLFSSLDFSKDTREETDLAKNSVRVPNKIDGSGILSKFFNGIFSTETSKMFSDPPTPPTTWSKKQQVHKNNLKKQSLRNHKIQVLKKHPIISKPSEPNKVTRVFLSKQSTTRPKISRDDQELKKYGIFDILNYLDDNITPAENTKEWDTILRDTTTYCTGRTNLRTANEVAEKFVNHIRKPLIAWNDDQLQDFSKLFSEVFPAPDLPKESEEQLNYETQNVKREQKNLDSEQKSLEQNSEQKSLDQNSEDKSSEHNSEQKNFDEYSEHEYLEHNSEQQSLDHKSEKSLEQYSEQKSSDQNSESSDLKDLLKVLVDV